MRHICRAVRHWKQRLVTLDGVGADIPPALITLAGGTLVGAHSLEAVHGVVRDASVITAIALSDCDIAALAFEAYVDVGCRHDPGMDLAPLFAAGDPNVEEAVMVTVQARDRQWFARTFPYTYDGRRVCWKQLAGPPVVDRRTVSRQHRVLAEGFERQAERDGPPVMGPGSQLAIVDEASCEHMAVVSFAVMAPCPCGSGRPIEDCCAHTN